MWWENAVKTSLSHIMVTLLKQYDSDQHTPGVGISVGLFHGAFGCICYSQNINRKESSVLTPNPNVENLPTVAFIVLYIPLINPDHPLIRSFRHNQRCSGFTSYSNNCTLSYCCLSDSLPPLEEHACITRNNNLFFNMMLTI